ncbi:TPA: hypothetical protein DIC62_01465 [Candidatus Nomurabacteria bacterium]|nr:hypothetical protein [Candidatus Nomurabacteria bacterium]
MYEEKILKEPTAFDYGEKICKENGKVWLVKMPMSHKNHVEEKMCNVCKGKWHGSICGGCMGYSTKEDRTPKEVKIFRKRLAIACGLVFANMLIYLVLIYLIFNVL